MSNETYQSMWTASMNDIAEQISKENDPTSAPSQVGFEHFAKLYIKYIQICRRIEDCYDNVIHAQKREALKAVLESLFVRITEIKGYLIHYNPIKHHPLVSLDDILASMRLDPRAIEWKVPRYFQHDTVRKDAIDLRKQLIDHWLSTFEPPESASPSASQSQGASNSTLNFSLEQAARIIQRNERGRQSILLVSDLVMLLRKPGKMTDVEWEMFRHRAATRMSAFWKGTMSRTALNQIRQNEFENLGLVPKQESLNYQAPLSLAREARKSKQAEAEVAAAQGSVAEVVAMKRMHAIDEIAARVENQRQWIFAVRSETGAFPESAVQFYLKDQPLAEEVPKVKTPESTPGVEIGTSAAVQMLGRLVVQYADTWQNLPDDSTDYDKALMQASLQAQVEADIKTQVDNLIRQELDNLKLLFDKGKSGKAKKGKKGKKGKKAKKGKKEKKWNPAIGLMTDVTAAVAELVQDRILINYPKTSLTDFIHGVSFVNSLGQSQALPFVLPPQPTAFLSNIVEHCVLPLACTAVRQQSPVTAKSLLLYGPGGNGKRLLARAIASEAGAAFFDVSPSVIGAKYTGKAGPAVLFYKIYLAARAQAPSVIFFDHAEQVFKATKKKKNAEVGVERFKNDIVAFINQIKIGSACTDDDRVLVIATTSEPYVDTCDKDALISAFTEKIWINFPEYSSRVTLWLHAMEARGLPPSLSRSPTLNLSLLARASEGFSAQAIVQATNSVLTEHRVSMARTQQLQPEDFLPSLMKLEPCWPEQWKAFRQFDHEATGQKGRVAKKETNVTG